MKKFGQRGERERALGFLPCNISEISDAGSSLGLSWRWPDFLGQWHSPRGHRLSCHREGWCLQWCGAAMEPCRAFQDSAAPYQTCACVTLLEQSQGKLSPWHKSKKLVLVSRKILTGQGSSPYFTFFPCSFSIAKLAFNKKHNEMQGNPLKSMIILTFIKVILRSSF